MAPREIAVAAQAVPDALRDAVAGYRWACDTVGESGGSVHRLHAPGRPTLFLKSGAGAIADAIRDEAARLGWLAAHSVVPGVRGFVSDEDAAWLLMTAIPGRTAYQVMTDAPDARPAVVAAMARHLRTLHAIPVDACPFDSSHGVRLAQARLRIDAGLVETDDFDAARAGWSAERVWQAMLDMLPLDPDTVVTHGDYSLDNILFEGDAVTGCIDVGRAGAADRYQDIAILLNCLDEFDDGLQPLFLAEYGIARLDRRKRDFHLCLDEMF